MEEVMLYYKNCISLKKILEIDNSIVYLREYFENENKKNFILKISSYFEKEFDNFMLKLIEKNSSDLMKNYIYKECVDRKFYKIFNFDITPPRNGANAFFNKFGSNFSEKIKEEIKKKQKSNNIEDFILLIRERNQIIHTGKGSLVETYTMEELYIKLESANSFFEFLFNYFSLKQ